MPKQKKPDPSDTKFNRFKRIAKWTFNNTPLAEILFISTFVLIRWWNNSDFSYLSEIFIPVVAFSVLVTAIFYIYRFIFGPGLAAHAAALSLSYLLYVFQFIEGAQLGKFVYGLIPDSVSSPFNRSLALAFVLGLLCWLIVWLLAKFLSRFPVLKQLQPYKILLFVIVFVFFVQVFRCADRMFEMRHQLAYNYPSPALEVADSQDDVKKPDIYYLVFDRYANPEMLKENFDFDNSEIVDSLAGQGFVTRQNAYSNYAFTMSSISSTLAMDYFPDLERRFGSESKWQSAAPYRSILRNPPVAQLLKSQGYQYNQVSSWWDFTRIGIDADKQPTLSYRLRVLNKSFYLSDLQRDIFFKSILSPWFKKGLSFGNWAFLKYDIDRNPVENFNAQMASLKGISSRGDKSNPQFTFAHILAPHPPYVFDENGNLPTYDVESNDNGVDEAVKYTNELKYINKRLMELVAYFMYFNSFV